MSRYVIKATGPSDWRGYQNCEIGISIGNPNHEGDKFRSILQWADKRFDQVIVTLSDTLNRYTIMCDGLDEAEAYFKTRKIGDLWIEDNDSALQSMANAELVLKRWDDWLKHPDYENIYNQVKEYRNNDEGFYNALHSDAHNYLSRRNTRGEGFDYERAFNNSMNFFVEEIACYVLIGRTYGALRAYPARDMYCFSYMRGNNVPEHLKGLERAPHTEINFKKKIKTDGMPQEKAA